MPSVLLLANSADKRREAYMRRMLEPVDWLLVRKLW